MEEPKQVALEFLGQQLNNLEAIRAEVLKAINAVLAKEQFHKWKKLTLSALSEKVGPGYANDLSKDWLETNFIGGDMYDELADDIDMCVRHLKKLKKEIEAKGLGPEPTSRPSS